jgi:hypothetical protein
MADDDYYLRPSEALAQSEVDFQRKSAVVEMNKALLDQTKIKMITDLSSDGIRLVNPIFSLSKNMGLKSWEDIVNTHLELLLSVRRQSRKEIIDASIGVSGKKPFAKRLKDVFSQGD